MTLAHGGMRGIDIQQTKLFHQLSYERVIPPNHPLRHIRRVVDAIFVEMNPLFEQMYADEGRPSIAPERLLRALLVEALYSIRSDRQLVERLQYDLLVKWFVGLDIDEDAWDASTFSRNRDRLMEYEVSRRFFERVLAEAHRRRLLSQKHFTVDGTLIQAWASVKSVRPIDDDDEPPAASGRNPDRHFHGQKRSNETHQSTTDPEARLYRKGDSHGAVPSFMGHVMTENRHGLVVDGEVTIAHGRAEFEAALRMTERLPEGSTVGADKGYDTREVVSTMRQRGVVPHIARNINAVKKRSLIDGRTTTKLGYAISQRRRKIVEEVFAWVKTIAGMRKAKWIGRAAIEWRYVLALAGYNLVRMTTLARSAGAAA